MSNKNNNLFWQTGDVTRGDRQKLLGQKGVTLWFTGLSGSGKSTVAVAVEKALIAKGKLAYRLDGDNIRIGINNNLGFSPEDRTENIRRIGEIAKLFVDAGVIVLSSFISPYEKDRAFARDIHEKAGMDFFEIFVDCPLSVVEARDTKGLYKKARSGEISNLTGVNAPYEIPNSPDVQLNTSEESLEEEVEKILKLLESNHYLE